MDGFPESTSPGGPDLPSLESLQNAPPPPPEVKVRTMRSDLESMANSGGGLPRFENVKVSTLTPGNDPASVSAARKKNFMLALVVAAILAIAGVLGYFAYRTFFGSAPSTTPTAPVTNQPSTTQNAAPTSQTAQGGNSAPSGGSALTPTSTSLSGTFTHTSLFKKPADQNISITFSTGGAVESAADLQSYGQKMQTALAGAGKTSPFFIEMLAKSSSDGHDLSATELFAAAGASTVIDPAILSAHFNPDATFFVYRDKGGVWPGYVLSLKAGENWLFLKNDVAKLESSSELPSLFLNNVTAPSVSSFTDGTIASTTVRMETLSGSPTSTFVYGWIGNDLILSTSQAGFIQAVAKL